MLWNGTERNNIVFWFFLFLFLIYINQMNIGALVARMWQEKNKWGLFVLCCACELNMNTIRVQHHSLYVSFIHFRFGSVFFLSPYGCRLISLVPNGKDNQNQMDWNLKNKETAHLDNEAVEIYINTYTSFS